VEFHLQQSSVTLLVLLLLLANSIYLTSRLFRNYSCRLGRGCPRQHTCLIVLNVPSENFKRLKHRFHANENNFFKRLEVVVQLRSYAKKVHAEA